MTFGAMGVYCTRFAGIGVLAIALAACTTVQTTAPGAVGIERPQRMLVSEEDVEKGAEQAYAQELQKAREADKLNKDPALTARVRAITDRLIPATPAFPTHTPARTWQANTLTTDEMND